MVIQHPSKCQEHGPLSNPGFDGDISQHRGMSAANKRLLAEMIAEQKCDVLCIHDTHRGQIAVRPRIRGMRLVAEIPHEQ